MIIGAWKPKVKTSQGKKTTTHYEKVNLEDLSYNNPTNIKVIYKCDNPDCKYPENTYSINLGHLKEAKKGNYHATNTLEEQICRSCKSDGKNNGMYGETHTEEARNIIRESAKRSQQIILEKYGVENISCLDSIKEKKGQTLINEENAKDMCDNLGLEFLELNGNNKYAWVKVKCENGHIFKRMWAYLKKGISGCNECFYNRLREQGIKNLKGFRLYHRRVYQYTSKTLRDFPDKIEDMELRSREWHLDHKFSICEGFKNNMPPFIIASYHNLEIIAQSENLKKQDKCSISKKELFNRYFTEGE